MTDAHTLSIQMAVDYAHKPFLIIGRPHGGIGNWNILRVMSLPVGNPQMGLMEWYNRNGLVGEVVAIEIGAAMGLAHV